MDPTKTPGQNWGSGRGRITNRLSLDCDPAIPILARAPTNGKLAMIAPACKHDQVKRFGYNRNGSRRFRCVLCGLR